MERLGSRLVRVGIAMLLAGCAGGGPSTDPAGETSAPGTSPSVAPAPVPEGQSLMDPGSYVANVEPNAVITTTSSWYGAANGPGFVVFGQLDRFPYAELYLMNIDEVIEQPGDPGNPWKTVPAPDDLFTWFVERTGAEAVGEPVAVEIGGYQGRQADIRVPHRAGCAPKSTLPFPEACRLIFAIEGEPPVFSLSPWMRYRLVVLPDVEGRTVTILYSDDPQGFPDRVQVADEVIRSITFDG